MKKEMIENLFNELRTLEKLAYLDLKELNSFYGKYYKINSKMKKSEIIDNIKERYESNKTFKNRVINFLKVKPIFTGNDLELYFKMSNTNRKWLENNNILNVSEKVKSRLYSKDIYYSKYSLIDVLNCQNDQRFKDYMIDTHERSEIARKAAATRKINERLKYDAAVDNFKRELVEYELDIPKLDEETLYKKAMDSQINMIERRNLYYDYDYTDPYSYVHEADNETKRRWIDNYIRHHLTDYDDILYYIKDKDVHGEMYDVLIINLEKQIKKVYPDYRGKYEN